MGRNPPGTPLIPFPEPGYIEVSEGEQTIFHLTGGRGGEVANLKIGKSTIFRISTSLTPVESGPRLSSVESGPRLSSVESGPRLPSEKSGQVAAAAMVAAAGALAPAGAYGVNAGMARARQSRARAIAGVANAPAGANAPAAATIAAAAATWPDFSDGTWA